MSILRWLARLTRKTQPIRRKKPVLQLELLEDRTVPSTVYWNNPSGGNFDNPSNWSSGSVPGSGDDAIINTSAAATIIIQSGDYESVNSLTTAANDTLSFTGGALTVAANSIFSGPLTMTGGSLTASGAAATLTANGTTSVSDASLFAQAGGQLALPGLTSYSAGFLNTFSVDGAGSVLNLNALTSFDEGSGDGFTLSATNGGDLNLSGLTNFAVPYYYYGDPISVSATNGSEIDLSALTSLSYVSVNDTGGSTILDGNLTTLNSVTITLDGTDTEVANAWTSLTDSSLTVTGGSYSLPGLTDLDGSSLYVSGGGSLDLPGLTSYNASYHYNYYFGGDTFAANGPGSVLDLSALTNLNGESGSFTLSASNGGDLDLSGLTNFEGSYYYYLYGNDTISATTGGEINLSALASLSYVNVTDTGGSTILDGNLTALSILVVTLDGTDTQVANAWTSFTYVDLAVTGGAYSLPGLTNVDYSSFYVSDGGSLDLPGLTNYNSYSPYVFSVDGSGSVLNLSALTNVNEQNGPLSLSATDGGELNLSGLTTTTLSGGYLTDTGGSTILLPSTLTTLDGVNVTLDGTDQQVTDYWNSLTDGSLTLDGGSYSLPGLTDLDGSNLNVSDGGSLDLPGLTSYSSYYGVFSVDGSSSVLNLSALANITAEYYSYFNLSATNGGELDLSGLTTLSGVSLTDTGGSTILLPSNLTTLNDVSVTLDGTDQQVAEYWTSFTHGNLTLYGGSYSLPGLTDLDGSNLYVVSGGNLELPGLTSYSSYANVFYVDGSGSVLNLSALANITADYSNGGVALTATSGGELDLSGLTLTTLSGVSVTDTGGSTILLPSTLTTLTDVNVTLDGTDQQVAEYWTSFTDGSLTLDGGSYSLPGLTDIDGSSLIVNYGGNLTLPGVTSFTASNNDYYSYYGGYGVDTFSVDGSGSVLDLSALTNVNEQNDPLSLAATDGGELNLSGLTTTTLTGGSLTDTGGSTILLPSTLTTLNEVNVALDGTDQQVADYWTSLTDGSFTLDGGSYSLPGLTDIDGSSLIVYGGNLTLLGVTSYSADGSTFSAYYSGSVLDLSALTTINEQTGPLTLGAYSGGEINVSGLTSFSGGSIYDEGYSTILDGNVSSLNGVSVYLDGTDPQVANSWTSLTNGYLQIDGGSNSLPGLTDIDGSNLTVYYGGSLSLPGVTSYSADYNTFAAYDYGSVLDLSALTTINQQNGPISLIATNGGEIELSELTNLSAGPSSASINAYYYGEIDLSGLTTLSNASLNDMYGTILDGNLTTLNAVNVNFYGTDPQVADAWTSFTDGSFSVTGGSYSLPGLTDIDGSSLFVNYGGTLALPGVTSYAPSYNTLLAQGYGSVLDLSDLTTVSEQNGPVYLSAYNGGEILLSVSQFALTPASSTVQAGTPVNFTLVAEDPFGNVVSGYTGTVYFSASDGTAHITDANTGLPLTGNSYTFTSADAGMHTFTVTDTQAGNLVITATDYLTSTTGEVVVYVPTQVTDYWINPNGGNFDDPANWSTGTVPSSSDNAVINTTAAATITIQPGDSESVLSLTTAANDTLSFTGGALTVAANSIFSGPLTMTGGSLTASGAAATLTANGTTSVSNASLFANAGGQLALPGLTSYSDVYGATFSVDGAGSVLNLNALTSIDAEYGSFTLSATNGGDLNLSGLTNFEGPYYYYGYDSISATAGSEIDLSALTSLNGVYITDTGGSTILDGNLTTPSYVDVTLDGTDTQVANAWTSFNFGNLTVTGGAYSLPGLTNVDYSSLYVSGGGSLDLPGLTSYNPYYNSVFSVDGSGSVLNLSALTNITSPYYYGVGSLSATDGGELNLSGLTTTTLTAGSLTDTGGSTILLPSTLTTLDGVIVTLDGTDQQVADYWTSLTDGSLTLNGGSYSLPGLTDIDGSSLIVNNGGSLTLLGATSFTASYDYFYDEDTFSADGPGSVLDLSALTNVNEQNGTLSLSATGGGELNLTGLTTTTLTGGSLTDTGGSTILLPSTLTTLDGVNVTLDGTDQQVANSWTSFTNGYFQLDGGSYSLPGLTDIDGSSLSVYYGGSLSLPGVTSYSADDNNFLAYYSGSVLDLSALTTINVQNGPLSFSALYGGEINVSGLTSFSGGSISDEYNSTILDGNVSTLNGVSVYLDGTDPQVANSWTSFTNGYLEIDGGSYSLPGLTDIDGSSLSVYYGGSLSLPGVTSYSADYSNFEAYDYGSVLDLSALTTINVQNGPLSFSALYGGEINVSGLTSFSGGSISDEYNSTILDGNVSTLNGVSVYLDGTDPQVANSWTSFTNGYLEIDGGSYSLPGLTDIDGSSLSVYYGGSLSLPGVTSYSADYSNFETYDYSSLDLSALTTINQQNGPISLIANYGCVIELSGLTNLSAGPSSAFISAYGYSEIDLSGLTTLSNAYLNDTYGSTILDGNLTTLNAVNVTLDGTDTQVADAWTSFTDGSFSVTGGSYSLPGLTDIDGSSLYVSNGGTLALPGVTSYAPSYNTLSADGYGSVLDLSDLTTVSEQNGPVYLSATNGGEILLSVSQFALTPDSSTVQAGTPVNFTLVAEDPFGNVVSGYTGTVYFSASDGTGQITDANTGLPLDGNSYTFTSADAGMHTFTVTDTQAGNLVITATDYLTSTTGEVVVVAAAPASISTQAGSGQSAGVDTAYSSALEATVEDQYGNPVSGVAVTFQAPTQGATGTFAGASSVTVMTDANGLAVAPAFTAGTMTGSYDVTASVNGVTTPASFSLTNLAVLSVASTSKATVLQNVTSGLVQLATFTETGGSVNAGDYTATVAWGDGSSGTSSGTNPPVSITISGTQVSVSGTHTYAAAGLTYPIVTLAYGGASVSTNASAIVIDVAADVTSHTKSSASAYSRNLKTKLTTSTLTVTNTGSTSLSGEFYLVLQGLTAGVTLQTATLYIGGQLTTLTIDKTAAGDPMIVIPSSLLSNLAKNQSFQVVLGFNDPSNIQFGYNTKLYSDPYNTL